MIALGSHQGGGGLNFCIRGTPTAAGDRFGNCGGGPKLLSRFRRESKDESNVPIALSAFSDKRRRDVWLSRSVQTRRQASRQVRQRQRQTGRQARQGRHRETDRQAGRQVNRQAGRQVNRQAGRQGRDRDAQAGRCASRQTRQTQRQTDRQAGKQSGRQTETHRQAGR